MKKIIKRRAHQESQPECLQETHPLLQRVYAARDIRSLDEIDKNLNRLIPYQSLSGIDKATHLLADALAKRQKILIVGDFDADGATSSAVAVRALRAFGAHQVDYLVPNRFAYGYGLTPELVAHATTLSPDLIVTVDNGIANHAGVDAAKALGITVLVTDHHLPAETLPDADAIVNPNLHGDTFPSKCLAGVGVIFYVMLALRRHLQTIDWFKQKNLPEPNMGHLLDIVALGTVADLVPLDRNNRILVHHGLRRIRSGLCAPGIIALLEQAKRDFRKVTAADLGFAVAARLNAAGRLDDMSLGISCLLTDDSFKARELATQLDQLNLERRSIERNMQTQALASIDDSLFDAQDKMPIGLCMFDEKWHQGVIGILASRLKDRFYRPVIVFAPGQDGEIKGSARSIAGLHVRDVLALMDARHPGLILKFGGHAMAAGLTIRQQDYEHFASIFDEFVSQQLSEDDLQHAIITDGELTEDEFNLEIAAMLRDAGPWGQAFPEPLFDNVFHVLEQRIVGDKHLKLKLQNENKVLDAIAFFVDTKKWPNHRCEQIHAAYRLDINEFRQRQNLQLMLEYFEAV